MPELLASIIYQYSKVQVFIMGDIMLDRFIYGKVSGISPEAPVPVFKREKDKNMLGGAGNVLNNCAALGCKADIVCLCGSDEPGLLVQKNIRAVSQDSLCITVPQMPTIQKTRIIAGNNHLIRLDEELAFAGYTVANEPPRSYLSRKIAEADVVLLSDYGKGLLSAENCQTVIKIAQIAGKRVLVDPKGLDYGKYAGATLVKPNLNEFMAISGEQFCPSEPDFEPRLKAAAQRLMSRCGFDNLLVTLSRDGMIFFSARPDDPPLRIAAQAKEVRDVSGAGDTCLAVLGASLGAGADMRQAMKVANLAAGLAVAKEGTSSISAGEILAALSSRGI